METPSGETQSLADSVPLMGQKFDLLKKIGEGTFSSVYLATLRSCPDI